MNIKEKNKYIFLILMIFIVGIGAAFLVFNNPTNKLARQLELGKKYFLEQNYEQAIIAFQNVIEIDPNNVEAYNSLVDIYLAQGNYEDARTLLNQGVEITQNEELHRRNMEVTVIQENVGICEEIVGACNSNNYEAMWENAIELYDSIQSILGEEVKDFMIPIGEGNIGIHIEKGAYYYIYFGDYVNGVREGQGVCIIINSFDKERKYWAVGEWKNDKPNGKQTIYGGFKGTYNGVACYNYYEHLGNMIDGLWDGEVFIKEGITTGEEISYTEGSVQYKNGYVQIIEHGDDRGDKNASVHIIGYGIGRNQFYSGNVQLTVSKSGAEHTKGMLGYSNSYGGTSWQGIDNQ